MLRRFVSLLAFLLLMGTCTGALAQSSTIMGTVIDAQSRQPIVGASVTATSPNLAGERSADTDPQGNYRISDLPPGTYTLSFTMTGYRPYTRADVELRLNRTIRVNVEMLPESLGAPDAATPPGKQ